MIGYIIDVISIIALVSVPIGLYVANKMSKTLDSIKDKLTGISNNDIKQDAAILQLDKSNGEFKDDLKSAKKQIYANKDNIIKLTSHG